jgi:hypothetical protein
MARAHEGWKVLPHEPIVELAENLWWVRGSLSGMSLKRTMTVARLEDGRLVIHNAIALDDASMARLSAWGRPGFLVVPSAFHRLDAPAYKARFPSLAVYAPKGARAKVEEVLAVDGTYEDFPKNDTVRLEAMDGVNHVEGAMIVRSSDGVTVVLNDAVFNMDKKRDLLGYLFTTLLGSAPGPRVSRLTKLLLVKDRTAFRNTLERLAATPQLTRLVVAHENVASGPSAAAALRQATAYL